LAGFLKIMSVKIELDQFSHQKESGEVRDARGLLHVVCDDNDRAFAFQFDEQIFDLRRRDRVQCRTRLVK